MLRVSPKMAWTEKVESKGSFENLVGNLPPQMH